MSFKYKFQQQHDLMDCGPACLKMIASFYGKEYSLEYLREQSYLTKSGVSLNGIISAAELIGFKTLPVKITIEQLKGYGFSPCILYWNRNHFVVLYDIRKNFLSGKRYYKIADPAFGFMSLSDEDLKQRWLNNGHTGICLLLETTDAFFQRYPSLQESLKFKYLFKYLKPYKGQIFQLFFTLIATSIFSLIFPILTQELIDKGVSEKKIHVVFLLLLAQIFIFIGSSIIELLRNWITLFVGSRVNIQIVSDFLKKVLRLPIKFFDTKMMGDFNQRIQDQKRIEIFLTSHSLTTAFSLVNFLVFFFVLLSYNVQIILSYFSLTMIAILWSSFFLKRRKPLDYKRFQVNSENQESIYEMVNGIQELKLNRFENYKRNEWESIQIKSFGINIDILRLDQFQVNGFEFINQLKNIWVTYIAATLVIKGDITLGSMLSISYIIGQMNSPINRLLDFLRSYQDAKISLERLYEVQNQKDEEEDEQILKLDDGELVSDIKLRNVKFQYGSPLTPYALDDVSIEITKGKLTAIVGASGSGKTTLMKLLLKFYKPNQGAIQVGYNDLISISPAIWRQNCGIVMQDGYIFSDTIERNIACGDEIIDIQKLSNAVHIANLVDFIDKLPLGMKTKIGAAGNGISGGQKQRILIARAVYKNPAFIFFDEATSALDAQNELIIHNNLASFFKGKTVLVIAHRLSTVKRADNIIVLENGKVTEQGTHNQLVINKKGYFNLIKNQLELGL